MTWRLIGSIAGGGSGSGGVAVTFTQMVPSAVWNIPHSLSSKPVVEIFDPNGDPIEADVSYPTPTLVRIEWAYPTTGSVRLT